MWVVIDALETSIVNIHCPAFQFFRKNYHWATGKAAFFKKAEGEKVCIKNLKCLAINNVEF